MTLFTEVFMKFNANLVWFYYRKLCKGEVIGIENLPKPPFIIAANHVSYLDWILLYTFFMKERDLKVNFIAKKRLFNSKYFRFFANYTGTICVDQEKPSKELLISVNNTLKASRILGIFPEGKRSEDGKLTKAFIGVSRIAVNSKVPVVPVGLKGFYDLLPKGTKIPRIKKCSITFGRPLYFYSNSKTPRQKDAAEKCTREIMCAIGELTGQEYVY